ncbi:DUF488 family protein, partial [bacterium]|nr:DUF488 family protein [bacterium]
YLAIVMRHYPRFVPRDLVDAYLPQLAPAPDLFREFKDLERSTGAHDAAFAQVKYESRFTLQPEGESALSDLSERAREQDVYLLCQCALNQKCHTDLLLILAAHRWRAPTPMLRLRYPDFVV